MTRVLSMELFLESPRQQTREKLKLDLACLQALGMTASQVRFPEAPATLIKKRMGESVFTIQLRIEGRQQDDNRMAVFHVLEHTGHVIAESGYDLLLELGFFLGEFVSKQTFLGNYFDVIDQALQSYFRENYVALLRNGERTVRSLAWAQSHPLLWPKHWLEVFTLNRKEQLGICLNAFVQDVMNSIQGPILAELLEEPETYLPDFVNTLMSAPTYRLEEAGILMALTRRMQETLREPDSKALKNKLQLQEAFEALAHSASAPTEVLVRKKDRRGQIADVRVPLHQLRQTGSSEVVLTVMDARGNPLYELV